MSKPVFYPRSVERRPVEALNEALDQSPVSAHEWRILQGVLRLELLTRLLGISQSSARRYISGNRSTPDAIAARLQFLAFVVGDLAGAYNDIEVRRWFDRPRERFDRKTPAQALGDGWSPEDDGARRVREVARTLASSPATLSPTATRIPAFPFCGRIRRNPPTDGARRAS